MGIMPITPLNYCQFLLTSPFNYTQTYLSDHVEGLSHDQVNRSMARLMITSVDLWANVQETLVLSPNGYLLFDDTVLDKQHSQKIELVTKQYSGNAHKVIKGIGVVTCVYVNPDTNQFWGVDYRIYNPKEDGQNKLGLVEDMLNSAITEKQLSFTTVLMDSWYATQKLMQCVEEHGKLYYTVVKKNRKVDETKGVQPYQRVEDLEWDEASLQEGKLVKLHNFPAHHKVKLFRVTALPGRTEYVVTNDVNQSDDGDTRRICRIRWKIEEFHRELKQLTGIESCQCRKAIQQKNHIGCAMLVWARLKNLAYQTRKTVYELCHGQFDSMVTQLLASPVLHMTLA
jgi:hypothetical protein